MARLKETHRTPLVILIYLYIFIYYTFNTGTMSNHKVETESGWDIGKNVQFKRIIYTIMFSLNSVQYNIERKDVKVRKKGASLLCFVLFVRRARTSLLTLNMKSVYLFFLCIWLFWSKPQVCFIKGTQSYTLMSHCTNVWCYDCGILCELICFKHLVKVQSDTTFQHNRLKWIFPSAT